ncbi:hypothetical protein CP965_04695 [Halarcobacter mediterraneus]|uniref:Uncharacterized protein n=2 Tax=Halarcobacter mediterraneus TaxID=2023153 RepID=A0A4Q1ATJ9_9BACT|nr:hypothetical protein CP965_04695 [Halarcobacter mediterraneus]
MIYSSYYEQNKTYFVFIITTLKNYPKCFYHSCQEENELLILENSYYFYKNNKLIFFQELKSFLSEEQILNFLKNKFKVNNIKVRNKINENKKLIKKYTFFSLKQNYLFKVFLLYLVFILFFYFFVFSNNNIEKSEVRISELKEKFSMVKEKNKFFSFSNWLVDFYFLAKQKAIKIDSLKKDNEYIQISLSSKNKNSIYDFIKIYNSEISELIYDENTKEYKANANLLITRK